MVWSAFSSRRRDNSRVSRRFIPSLESLEDRTVPSAVQGQLATALTGGSSPGAFDPGTATWYLRSTNGPGVPDAGQFQYGGPNWRAVTGDWSGSGAAGIGVVDPKTATWYLRNESSAGAPDAGQFQYGAPDWIPLAGDWSGSGQDGIGVFDPQSATWYLRNEASAGAPDAGKFEFGMPGWLPVVGDWTGSGKDGIGVYDPATETFYLRNETSAGDADAGKFQFGMPSWLPVAGDWSATGKDGIGVFDPQSATWYLRNETSAGAPDAGQFDFGMPGWQPLADHFVKASTTPGTPSTAKQLVTLNLDPIDLNLLGLEVKTNSIQVTVSAQPGKGQLLGNLLTDVAGLLNLQGVNTALNNVLSSVVKLVNSTSLLVNGINTSTGPLSTAPTVATTPVLDLFVAPVHLNLLGALVDTSPIHLTITAHSGQGLLLGNVVTDLANLFNPPLPNKLDLDFINTQLQKLIDELNVQIPGIGSSPTTIPSPQTGTEEVLRLTVAPINVNLLGLILKTSQIQVNVDAQTGDAQLLGNVLTTLLNTLGATPQNLSTLNTNLNALLAKVVGVLNAASLVLPTNALNDLSQVLQTLALPNLVNATGTDSTPILNLVIASTDGTTPPVDVDLLGLLITTSNIQAQLIAQTGDGQILGNLLYNVANLLNPGGSLNLLTILNELGL